MKPKALELVPAPVAVSMRYIPRLTSYSQFQPEVVTISPSFGV